MDGAAGPFTDPLVRLDVGNDPPIRIDLLPKPAVHTPPDDDGNFGANLAEKMAEGDLGRIAMEIEEGVQSDIQSRAEWITQYRKGLELLGTKIEDAEQSNGRRRNISRVGHPLLMEAMVRYQASAEGEMLPAAGPVKVMTVGRSTDDENSRAKDFEDDFNYILTEVVREYYDDTSSMLMHQAYCGLGYKKVFYDPMRQRPTSQSILAPDLIVSEGATDLQTALRVTHETEMSRPMLRRMQILGHYRDIPLGTPLAGEGLGRQAQRKLAQINGQSPVAVRPQDQPYLIWETDGDLDWPEYGIDFAFERRTPEGLPLPYKVAIDCSTHRVLGLWRNWRPDDPLCLKHNMYVKYSLIPAMGYHPWGFIHLLGNQTRALRSIWRLLIDAGYFSNFPGGIKAKNARIATNDVAPGPGEWLDVDGMVGPNADVRSMFMPMPYNPPNPVFVQLAEIIKNDSMRLGSTVMLEVGEGRTNVPVGTVMAMIEQQVQVMAGVHKRNHRSQREELRLLRELFAEDPASLSRFARLRPRPGGTPARQWEAAEEFMDLDLVPASDPNVPAQVHRLMMGNVLVMLAQQAPQYFDVPEVLRTAVRLIGADPDKYVVQPGAAAPPPPDPKVVAKTMELQQQQQDNAAKAQTEMAKLAVQRQEIEAGVTAAAAQNQTSRDVAAMKLAGDREKAAIHAGVHPAFPPAPPGQGLGMAVGQ